MPPTENTGKKEPDEPDDDLTAALGKLGAEGEGTVHIWRQQDGAFAMLDRVAVRDFDPWTIGSTYGPGRYRFDFLDARNRYVKKALERHIAVPPASRPAAAPGVAAPAAALGFDPLALLIRNAERAEATNAAIMVALIQSLGNRGSAPAGNGLGVADIVAVMREARENATAPAPPHATMLELLREGMTLGRQIEGTDTPENTGGAMALFPKLLDVLAKVLPAAPAAPAALPAAVVPSRPAAPADPMNQFLSMFAPQLTAAASAGQDPTEFARLVVQMVPKGPMRKALGQFVFATPEQRRTVYTAGAPELLPFAPWIDRASDAARGFMLPKTAPFPRPAGNDEPLYANEPISVPAAAASTDDDEGCDDPDCNDPDCGDPDHYDGCDDEGCDDPDCDDPEHFRDDVSKEAARARRENPPGGRAYRRAG